MLTNTSTEWAPWHVIPADRKWFARLAAGAVIVNALIDIDPRYPTIDSAGHKKLQEIKKSLEAQAPPGAPADPFAASQAGGTEIAAAAGAPIDREKSRSSIR